MLLDWVPFVTHGSSILYDMGGRDPERHHSSLSLWQASPSYFFLRPLYLTATDRFNWLSKPQRQACRRRETTFRSILRGIILPPFPAALGGVILGGINAASCLVQCICLLLLLPNSGIEPPDLGKEKEKSEEVLSGG